MSSSNENRDTNPPVRGYVTIFVTGIFVSLIPLAIAEQDSTIASATTTLLIFIWYVSIFISGVPTVREHISKKITTNFLFILLSLNLVVPYIVLLGFGLILTETIVVFSFWYLLPTVLMIYLIQFHEHIKPPIRLVVSVVTALLYWIGFDHRYTLILFDVFNDLSYVMSGFWIASLMMIGYGFHFTIKYQFSVDDEENSEDNELKPSLHGLTYGQIASVAVSIFIVPIGLLTGFLEWNPDWPGVVDFLIGFIGIFLTIALQEELVFRGMILNEVDNYSLNRGGDPKVTLFLTSFAFGLTHWNNEVNEFVIHYIILATIAGIGYGFAYRKSGLFGAMIAHTLVDWIWSLVLLRA